MPQYTILYLAADLSGGGAVARSLRSAGCCIVTTDSPAQALALLFVNRRIDAVVLEPRSEDSTGVGFAKVLRSIRADIPILLVAPGKLDPLPRCIDACICAGSEQEILLSVLNTLLAERWNELPA